MKILIAEDDLVSRTMLSRLLTTSGHEVVVTVDGQSAWDILQRDDAPKLAILDWMMPEVDGAEVCRRVRDLGRPEPTYLILLTAKDRTEDVVEGLDSGANDYLVKPFERRELQARLRVAERMVALQHDLAERVRELQEALAQIHQLRDLLPICSYCKKIRDDGNYWQQVEGYLSAHTGVQFSHGVCPDCYAKVVAQMEQAALPLTRIKRGTLRVPSPTHHYLATRLDSSPLAGPSRTWRTFRTSASGEKGFCKKATSASRTPLSTMASSVYPEMYKHLRFPGTCLPHVRRPGVRRLWASRRRSRADGSARRSVSSSLMASAPSRADNTW